ncbi:hypothetical protein NDU88_006634 [Pleurodeles waltl]|uniref:Uncharacterized protein n=1 Tax=Pleurodeles waltl TaxID=8319 RepID=A0AAV7QI81_PLEWA|nr:hypothetical protein NDU88_006634 [Pleurodeles waltl]
MSQTHNPDFEAAVRRRDQEDREAQKREDARACGKRGCSLESQAQPARGCRQDPRAQPIRRGGEEHGG